MLQSVYNYAVVYRTHCYYALPVRVYQKVDYEIELPGNGYTFIRVMF